MNKTLLLATLLAAFAAQGAQAASVEAGDNATIQPAGPRSGSNGLAFFNIEGDDNGAFASYGLARFDLTAMKAGFDATYGIGGWKVESIALELVQSNAGFTNSGGLTLYFTGIDNNSPLQSSGLMYGNFASDFADASPILAGYFSEVATGTLDSYALYHAGQANSAGGNALAADLLADNTVTLALVGSDPSVAATYAGYTNFTYAGPTLVVNVAAVPEPETYALLLAGLGLVGFAARRRDA